MKILVINGPNLNLLGQREPETYGADTLEDIEHDLQAYSFEKGIDIEFYQSNVEGEIINAIQATSADGIALNPAGYSHTSVAIRDAIAAVNIPTVEVHLTNIYAREEFRQNCVIAPVCIGQICGFGKIGYKLGIDALIEKLRGK
jgi:3-dehydroquinate dehydratase II